jgi:hypothetical protein
MVVALHLPLREPGSYMADGDQVLQSVYMFVVWVVEGEEYSSLANVF